MGVASFMIRGVMSEESLAFGPVVCASYGAWYVSMPGRPVW